jgi:dTDP-4-amino-4,6-dideoxy-D-galactose acyltransferase
MELCEFLPWDTEFFGERIGRARIHRLNAQAAKAMLEWCATESIACLYFLADSDDPETVRLAEDHGFHLVDIRVTLEHKIESGRGEASSRPSRSVHLRHSKHADIPILQRIARGSYTDSRFYSDARFPVEKCEALYETWIKKSCEGHADVVLVAELTGQPAGYVSCHLTEDASRGQIGLVGVDSQARKYGLGSALVHYALEWFAGRGVDVVSVATQGRNIAGQRLYERCGFLTRAVQLWYHKWSS